MENKDLNFTGRGIITILAGLIFISSIIATLSEYLVDLIML